MTEVINCSLCGKSIINEDSEKRGGLCQDCFKEFVRVFNEKKMQNIMRLANHQPVIKEQDNGKPYYAFYLPTMMKVVEGKSDKKDVQKYHVEVNFSPPSGLKRIGDLVGMAGFYYDAEYYWATTAENVFDAWNWFNQRTEADEDYWAAVESDTVRDVIDNNWNPFTNEFRDTLTPNIISLILDLHALDLMKVDVSKKLSEIKQQMRGQIGKYEKLSRNIEFSTNYRFSREAMSRVTNLRKFLAHLSSESRLARLAKLCGFNVTLSIRPDLIINGKKIDVKKPDERYVIPKRKDFLTFVSDESTVVENLSNHISAGFSQEVDVVAIEVKHLDKREIKGFRSKWLGGSISLKNALLDAISYERKGIVLLFMDSPKGYLGRVLRCKKVQRK
jgi:hypothetical protein